MEKLKRLEEEKLKNTRLETESYVERELESLNLAKESFAAYMDHEKSELSEKYNNKESQMLHDFEVNKQKLDADLQNKEAEIENRIRERERSFEEERERELANVKYLRDVASREMEDMKLEREQLEKEKHDVFANQKHLKSQQLEMKNDIDDLVGLSMKLKDQREQFLKERERFVSFVEKQMGCKECGERVSEFVLSDLQSLTETKNADNFALPKLADGYLKKAVQVTSESKPNVGTSMGTSGSPGSGSRTLNWLKKCTSIFSAGTKNEREAGETETEAQEKLVDVGEMPEFILSSEDEPELSARVAPDSFDVQRQLDQSADDVLKHIVSQTHEIEEVGQQPDENEGQSKSTKRPRPRVTRARAKAAASDTNGVAENSVYTNEESRGVSKGGSRKRASEHEPGYSEQSDGVMNGPRKNRRQKVVEAPKVTRYNLRRRTGVFMAGDGTQSNQSKEEGADSKVQPGASILDKKEVGVESEAANKLPQDTVLSEEEVIGTPQQVREIHNDAHSIQTPVAQEQREEQDDDDDDDDDDDGDDEDEEIEHPGEVSIGRKLWTFIST